MRPFWSALLAATLLVSGPVLAGDHLVPPGAVRAALAEAAADRAANLALLDRVLVTAAAERAADRIGVRLDPVRRALPALSDDEARELDSRAAVLQDDPEGRFLGDLIVITLLVVLILVLIGVVAISSIAD